MKVKLEMVMDIDREFFEEAKRFEHHIEGLVDVDSYPEIKSISGVKVTPE